jgi:hypothetical protein
MMEQKPSKISECKLHHHIQDCQKRLHGRQITSCWSYEKHRSMFANHYGHGKAVLRICLCVCTHARVYACACMHVALLIQHAMCLHHIMMPFVAPLAPAFFSTLSHKGHDPWKKSYLTKNVYFDFLYNFYLKHFSL